MPDKGLPELIPGAANGNALLSLRHSITVTDYSVRLRDCEAENLAGKWVPISRLPSLPLTGLARKILRRVGAM
jgi:hypothetical protein